MKYPNFRTRQLKKRQRKEIIEQLKESIYGVRIGRDVTDYSREKNRSDELYVKRGALVKNISSENLGLILEARRMNQFYIDFGKELKAISGNKVTGFVDYVIKDVRQLIIWPEPMTSTTNYSVGQFFIRAEYLHNVKKILEEDSFKDLNLELSTLKYVENGEQKEGLHVNCVDYKFAMDVYLNHRGPDFPNHAVLSGVVPESDAKINIFFGEQLNRKSRSYENSVYLTDLI